MSSHKLKRDAPPKDPKLDELLHGELPPAKSPFPYGRHQEASWRHRCRDQSQHYREISKGATSKRPVHQDDVEAHQKDELQESQHRCQDR
ncbi:MAG: hypothetical protein Q9203_004339 [Teloschistes exilis]